MSGDHLNGPHVHIFGQAQELPHEQRDRADLALLLETVSDTDMDTIRRIVQRAVDLANSHGVKVDSFTLAMDLTMCHCNHYPLHLTQLLMTSDDNLSHDVFGIARFMDRRAGKLTQGFSPRHAKSGSINEGNVG